MPHISIYADEYDFRSILSFLNDEPQIAFIRPNGEKQWIAQKAILSLVEQRYCLWHIPSGPLPLLQGDSNKADELIREPWKGWTEKRTGADARYPYFGPGWPGVFWLNVRPKGISDEDSIGMSSFEWIGDHYKAAGIPAQPITKKWWLRLKRWVMHEAMKVPRNGSLNGTQLEVWAFPSAYDSFVTGKLRDDNPTF